MNVQRTDSASQTLTGTELVNLLAKTAKGSLLSIQVSLAGQGRAAWGTAGSQLCTDEQLCVATARVQQDWTRLHVRPPKLEAGHIRWQDLSFLAVRVWQHQPPTSPPTTYHLPPATNHLPPTT